MSLLPPFFRRIFYFLFCLFFSSFSLATVVTHVSEGKINNQTSIVVSLENNAGQVLDLPVIKDSLPIQGGKWQLSHDRTFQHLSIAEYGLGEYQVSLAGVKYTEALDQVETIHIHESEPTVRILGKGPWLNASGDRAIPIESVNVTGVNMSIFKVDNAPELFHKFFYTKELQNYQARKLRKNFSHIAEISFKTPASLPNESIQFNLTLPENIENGWYIIGVKPSNSFDSPELFHVLLSDIGLQAKRFGDQISIQAVDLNINQPLNMGEVTIYSREGLEQQETLNNGFAQLEYKERASGDIITVVSQDQITILPLKEVPLDLTDFAIGGEHERDLKAFIFSNRDLFKPGETVSTNILLRDIDGELTALDSLYVQLIKPNGTAVFSSTLDEPESIKGFFNIDLNIPPSAELGQWRVVVRKNQIAKRSLGQFVFNVAEFVPERMDLEIVMPETIKAGESIPVNAEGRYLFGQLASGNRLKILPRVTRIEHFPTKYKAFFVGGQQAFPYNKQPEMQELTLDANGQQSFNLNAIDSESLAGPALLTLTGQLFETGGAVTTRVKKSLVSNNKSIVGIQPTKERFSYFSDAEFNIALLDSVGSKLLEGEVNIKLERNRGGWYWEYNVHSGWTLKRDDNWRIVESTSMTLADEPAPLLLPTEWGSYRLTAISPDGQATIYPFYVGWQEGDDQIPVKPDQLTVKLDKESYLAGDVIELDVQSPVSGLLHIELVADKSYVNQTVHADKQTSVSLTLPKDLNRHDLYLVATLINTDEPYAKRLLSVAPVKLYRDNRKLSVTMEHEDRLVPLTQQPIRIKVESKEKLNDAFVVLTIADKGILNLSRYQVPNVFDKFYAQKRLGVDIIDLYSRQFISRPSSFLTHQYGGGAGLNSKQIADRLVESKTFNQVLSPIELDSNGEAIITVDVPDYNGEVQVVATVFDGNKFGQTMNDVAVSAPIVAELSMPRFFAVNDQSEIYLEAANQTEETQTVSLQLQAKNGVTLASEATQSFTLEPKQKAGFAVKVDIGNQVALSELILNVNSDVYTATRSWTIPVRADTPYITKTSTRILHPEDKVFIRKAQWNGVKHVVEGSGSITFSHSPVIETGDFVKGLFRYPYGCVEQTTSKAYPWLSRELLERSRGGESESSEEDIKRAVQHAVSKLSRYQKDNGGFGLWEDSKEDPWLTTYVADFLLDAKVAYPQLVSDDLLKKVTNRLHQYIYNYNEGHWLTSKAYIAYVLTKRGLFSYADAKSYLQAQNVEHARNKAHSELGAVYLGATFLMLGDNRTSQIYFKLAQSMKRGEVTRDSYDSPLSEDAKIVSVISLLDDAYAISPSLVELRLQSAERIFKSINNRNYFSTQEKYALAQAGLSLEQLNNHPLEITVNGESVINECSKEKGCRSASFDMKIGDAYHNTNNMAVYVTESIKGYADKTKLKSTIDAHNVTRSYFNLDGKIWNEKPLKVGDSLIVKVKFSLKERIAHGMLVEYLPTGMVLEDPNFTDLDTLFESLDLSGTPSEMTEYRNDRFVVASEFDTDKTYTYYYVMRAQTPGESVIPSSFIEDMYHPERFIIQDHSIKKLHITR